MKIDQIRKTATFSGCWPRELCYSPVCWYYQDGCLYIDIGAPNSGAQTESLDSLLPQVRHIFVNRGLSLLKQKPFSRFPNLESVTLSEQVQRLDWHDFEDCRALKKVTLPEGIRAIPSYTFYHCAALEEVNIPDSVTVFGEFAFCGCSSLKSLHIPRGLEEINRYALSGCAAFEQGLLSFDHCPKLKSVPKPGLQLPEDDGTESDDDYWFFGDAWQDVTENKT